MNIQVFNEPLSALDVDALVVVVGERAEGETGLKGAAAAAADNATAGWISELLASGEFTGKALDIAILPRPAGLKAKKLVAVGGGKEPDLRKIAGAAVRALKPKKAATLAIALDEAGEAQAAAAVEGAILGGWEPDAHKTAGKCADRITSLTLLCADSDAVQAGIRRGRILAESQNFTRDLVNEPGNKLTPNGLASHARQVATEFGLECDILNCDRMKHLGMGALLGVAMGSAEPPVLIVLKYKPEGEAAEGNLGLVGKGVTFDTGGISIKPSEGMEKMKYDMAGGAAVLGAMRALAQLKPRVAVTALIPAVENMPGDRAQRPGDIVHTLNGKTVEVLNTDAEGRLILCDALEYAKRLGCTHLVDAATLTGAIVVALGYVNVGMFTNNDGFRDTLLRASKAAGEKMWPMPLDDDYKDLLKSAFADLANIGGRWGGAISAAWFLKEFADPLPWIHLDIAGTAWIEDGRPFLSKGPSGVGVRSFVELAMRWGG